jgi:hypothetical protein
MHFLIHPTYCVPVCHFKVCKILYFSIEPILEAVNWLPEMLILREQRVLYIELFNDSKLDLGDLGHHFRAATTLPQYSHLRPVEKVQEHLVYVKLEGSAEIEGEKIIANYCLHNSLHKLDPSALPLQDRFLLLFSCGIGWRLLLHLRTTHQAVSQYLRDCYTFSRL